MKKFRFIAVVLALILVVGMTTGLIVRKQTGGQTVMQHSAQSPVISDNVENPSTLDVSKIRVLVETGSFVGLVPQVFESDVLVESVGQIVLDSRTFDVYYIDVNDSLIRFVSVSDSKGDLRGVDCWYVYYHGLNYAEYEHFSSSDEFDFSADVIDSDIQFIAVYQHLS